MAKFGYIMTSAGYDTLEQDREWMERFRCVEIVVERAEQTEQKRSQWQRLIDQLELGDTLVLTKLSNAIHGARQLVFFLEFCRLKQIRLIAIRDKIDSANELFPEARTSDVLTVIALLPKEANAVRRHKQHVAKVRKNIEGATEASLNRASRNQRVINMYLEGYTIDEIHAASGFRSRSSIFRVLNDAGIALTRGHTRGPLGPRKKKDKRADDKQ